MTAANIFKIENGVFGLILVDTTASGYSDSWQAPSGKTVDTVTIADYSGTNGIAFQCQVTKAALAANANTTTDVTPNTMCAPEVSTTIVGVTSYTLDASILQDPHVAGGITAYLFQNDTFDAFFYLGLGGDAAPPAAIGKVTVTAGAIGGDARVTLTADVTMPVKTKPDLWVGTAATNRVITGVPVIKATSMTAGIPGSFTPSTANWPTTLAQLTSASPAIGAVPTTAWTTGQYVALPSSGTHVHWSGTAWVTGNA